MKNAPQLLLAKLHTLDPFLKGLERKDVRASADTCIEALVTHLHWLRSRHCRTNNKTEYLVSMVFRKHKRFHTDTEIVAYCRTHLTVATSQMEKLVIEMRAGEDKVSAKAMKQFAPLIYDYMHDLRPIVEHLEQQKNPKYIFFRGAKSYHPMAWQLFRGSCQLAYMTVNASHLDHNVSHIAAVFMLRQAMEAKFERIIGVAITDKDLQTPRLRHGFHYDFVKDNLSYFQFSSVDFLHLEKIYQWCSNLIHKAVQPLAWQLPYAFDIVKGLFDSGEGAHIGSWSIHGGVRISNKAAMQMAFGDHFCRSYNHGIWCIDPGDTEAVSDE